MKLSKRIYSLDIFRGATVALMIVVNNPGSWSSIFPPLRHAEWHGVTPTDWVFPFFLFVVGMSVGVISSSLRTLPKHAFFAKVLKRTLLVFTIGLLLNHAPFVVWTADGLSFKLLSDLRIMGVLQRIALCYLFVCLFVYYLPFRMIVMVCLVLLVLYWAMFELLGADAPYSLEGYFGTQWDRLVFSSNHLYQGEGVPFDPEGLASTIGALGTTLMGYIFFCICAQYSFSVRALAIMSFLGLFSLVFTDKVWSDYMPLNKKIWTSSYAMYMSSLSVLVFVGLHSVFDRLPLRKMWAVRWVGNFCVAFGRNALFIFVLSGLLVRFLSLLQWEHSCTLHTKERLTTPWSYLYYDVVLPYFADSRYASFLCALLMLFTMWLVAYVLNKKRWYIKV